MMFTMNPKKNYRAQRRNRPYDTIIPAGTAKRASRVTATALMPKPAKPQFKGIEENLK